MARKARPLSSIAAAAVALAVAACGGGDAFRASADFSGTCSSGGTRIFVFMTSNDLVRVDVRIEDGLLEGQLDERDVEVDAMSKELGPVCACTCSPGEPLGTVVIESEGEVIETVDLGKAPDECCESGP